MTTAPRRLFTNAEQIKVDPWQVRAGDLIAQATDQPGLCVGWRVTRSHTQPNGAQWIEFTAVRRDGSTWDGHFDQPPQHPVWIVRRGIEQ